MKKRGLKQNEIARPLVLLAVMILLSLVATAACIGPTRDAVNVDPMTALRYE